MGTIETFEHTADVGLRIRGTDREDLLRTAAEGIFDYIVVNRDQVRPETVESVALQADSLADLLVSWLNELIFRLETQHRLYSEFDVHVAQDELSLQAEIWGEPIDHDRHILDHEVKAVTHHGLTLTRDGLDWVGELILDL